MKKIIFVFIFCVYGVCLFSQNTKSDIIKYVEENYDKMLEQIPLGQEKLFGFESRDMFNQCEVGNPIRLLKIVNGLEIAIADEWRVPLLINGKYITLLTVIELNQNYEIVDIGGKMLAEFIDSYNNENEKISLLLRDYKKQADYISFEYKSLSDKNFYKIRPGLRTTNGISLEEIIRLHNINNE